MESNTLFVLLRTHCVELAPGRCTSRMYHYLLCFELDLCHPYPHRLHWPRRFNLGQRIQGLVIYHTSKHPTTCGHQIRRAPTLALAAILALASKTVTEFKQAITGLGIVFLNDFQALRNAATWHIGFWVARHSRLDALSRGQRSCGRICGEECAEEDEREVAEHLEEDQLDGRRYFGWFWRGLTHFCWLLYGPPSLLWRLRNS